MKLLLLLSVMFGLILSQAAFANDGFGMDESYNQSLNNQHGSAVNSTADGDTEAYSTHESAWQDMNYVQRQYAPQWNVQAPMVKTPYGTVSTFKGTTGQSINTYPLPEGSTGLMAVAGGYVRAACRTQHTGGFKASLGSRIYPSLPPTSTSSVDFNIVK